MYKVTKKNLRPLLQLGIERQQVNLTPLLAVKLGENF